MSSMFRQLARAPIALLGVFRSYGLILSNANYVALSMVVNSLLGFAYWWFAARFFPPVAAGFASAIISTMLLLGIVSTLGWGTLLVGELSGRPTGYEQLLATAFVVVGLSGLIIGASFALVAPFLLIQYQPLRDTFWLASLFALGVMATALAMVLDQVLLGLLQAGAQLQRNSLFSLLKLGLLVALVIMISARTWEQILETWVLSLWGSLLYLLWRRRTLIMLVACRPQPALWRALQVRALEHHVLNLALLVPGTTLPIIAASAISAEANASFYVAFILATFVFTGPAALASVLFAAAGTLATGISAKLRFTLSTSFLVGVLGIGAVVVGGDLLLSLFGHHYVTEASPCLRILTFGVLPAIVRDHYVTLCRITQSMRKAALPLFLGGLLEILLALLGALWGGMNGLSAGWLTAMVIQAALMGPTVYQYVRKEDRSRSPQ